MSDPIGSINIVSRPKSHFDPTSHKWPLARLPKLNEKLMIQDNLNIANDIILLSHDILIEYKAWTKSTLYRSIFDYSKPN